MAYIVSIPGETADKAERFVDSYATRQRVDITFHEKHAQRFVEFSEAQAFAWLAEGQTGSAAEVVEVDRYGWRTPNALQRAAAIDVHAGEL